MIQVVRDDHLVALKVLSRHVSREIELRLKRDGSGNVPSFEESQTGYLFITNFSVIKIWRHGAGAKPTVALC